MVRRAPVLPLCLVLVAFGCNDLEQYHTPAGKAFEGVIVGTDGESFIRRGFPAGTVLDLTFDPANASRVDPPPGKLTAKDPVTGNWLFHDTKLVPIAPLAHDQLSQYDFPGSGRVRNYIFYARPDATSVPMSRLVGRDAMVFVSLLEDGGVEVRIMARTMDGCGMSTNDPCDFYGFWPLTLEPTT